MLSCNDEEMLPEKVRSPQHHQVLQEIPQGHGTPQLLCRGLNLFVTGQEFVSIPSMYSKDNAIYPMGKFWGLR